MHDSPPRKKSSLRKRTGRQKKGMKNAICVKMIGKSIVVGKRERERVD